MEEEKHSFLTLGIKIRIWVFKIKNLKKAKIL